MSLMRYLPHDNQGAYCPYCEGKEPTLEACSECNDEGFVECDYGHEHECPLCRRGYRRAPLRDDARPSLCEECLSLGSIAFAREYVHDVFLSKMTRNEQLACIRVGVAVKQTTLGTFVVETHEAIPTELQYRWCRDFDVFGWKRQIDTRGLITSMKQLRAIRETVNAWRQQNRDQWLRGAA